MSPFLKGLNTLAVLHETTKFPPNYITVMYSESILLLANRHLTMRRQRVNMQLH